MTHARIATLTATLLALALLLATVLLGHPADTKSFYAAAASTKGGVTDADAGMATDLGRLRAYEDAVDRDTAGITAPVEHIATPGWGQAQPFSTKYDEWEPAVGADPNAPYVYMLATRYGGPSACGDCPWVKIMLRVSADGGDTFGPATYLCACSGGKNQYDPEIVVADDGTVYAAMLQGYAPGVSFMKSTDHGATWTDPISFPTAWSDKPAMVTSPDGVNVYIAFNGPSAGDAYIAQSHDSGGTWDTTKVIDTDRYTFANAGFANDSGLVAFSENDFNQFYTGVINTFALVSTDDGATWTRQQVDVGHKQPDCTSLYCYDGYYGSIPGIAGTDDGTLLMIFNHANSRGHRQRVYVSRSTDAGATWSTPYPVSAQVVLGAFPAGVGMGQSTFRITYMDKTTGRFNTWSRESTDGGVTWGAPQRISNNTKGAAYLNTEGFREAYGDYQQIVYTSAGRAFAVWGAGPTYYGPGGVWFNESN